jgi:hypothetical protein
MDMAENIDGAGSSGADDPGAPPASESEFQPAGDGGVGVDGASVDSGHAPAVDGDAASATKRQGAAAASPATTDGLTFTRRFKTAEELRAFETDAGRVRQLQSNFAKQEKRLAEFEALKTEHDRALRLLTLQQAERGQGGAAGSGAPAKAEPKSWAEEINESGDLKFVADQMRDASVEHGLYALVDLLEKRTGARVDRALSETVQPLQQKTEFNGHLSRVMTAVKTLSKDFPELREGENEDAPEMAEARQEILNVWRTLPRELSLGDPVRALKIAVREYRETHGLPASAALPGSSGSPSAGVTDAAEAARAAAASGVVDGSGTPRPRPNGGTRPTVREQFEREMLDDSNVLRDPTGESLGFGRIVN